MHVHRQYVGHHANLISFEYFDEKPLWPDDADRDFTPALGVIDVGSDTTNVVVSTRDGAWYRSISIGGDTMTQALVREFKLTFQQAEQLKRDPSKNRRMSQFYGVLLPIFEEIGREIQRSFTSYQSIYKDHRIERVLCLGGGMHQHGLARFLRLGR